MRSLSLQAIEGMSLDQLVAGWAKTSLDTADVEPIFSADAANGMS